MGRVPPTSGVGEGIDIVSHYNWTIQQIYYCQWSGYINSYSRSRLGQAMMLFYLGTTQRSLRGIGMWMEQLFHLTTLSCLAHLSLVIAWSLRPLCDFWIKLCSFRVVEANSFSSGQEIPCLLWNSKFRDRIHKSPPPAPILIRLM
jgi:hypothetical protein